MLYIISDKQDLVGKVVAASSLTEAKKKASRMHKHHYEDMSL